MATGFDYLAQAGIQHKERQKELEDEQRKTTLKTLQEDAETPQDKVAAIQAVYHKDPGVLKQHVENLTRRITGKQPQPVVTPEQAQQARLAPLVARGKTPDQQALDQQKASGNIANQQSLDFNKQEAQQKQQQMFGMIDQYIKDPEQNKTAKEEYTRKQAGIQNNFKNLPGASGQPYKSPNGQWVRSVEGADGAIVEQPMPAGYTGPQVKPEKVGSFGEFVASAYGPNATAQQVLDARKQWAAAAAGTTEGTHSIQVPQTDGSIKLFTVSTTSHKDFDAPPLPGAQGPPSSAPAPRKHATSNGHAQGSEGRVVGGRQTPAQVKANEAVDTAENAFLDVQKASKDPTPVGDQGVILAWLRGRVNRVTATEIAAVNNLGGATMKLEGAVVRIESGKMTDQQRQWFLRSAKDNYDTAQQVASKYGKPAPQADTKGGGGKSLADRLNEALQ